MKYHKVVTEINRAFIGCNTKQCEVATAYSKRLVRKYVKHKVGSICETIFAQQDGDKLSKYIAKKAKEVIK